jgi:exosome complex component RRP45
MRSAGGGSGPRGANMITVKGSRFIGFDGLSTPKGKHYLTAFFGRFILDKLYAGFVVDSIVNANMRMDGRVISTFRDPQLQLTRQEEFTSAELCLGSTRVIATVRGELVAPYADRPTEGILQFNCNISLATKSCGYYDSDIIMHLEKYVKQSDAVDLESLCVLSGKRVWLIVCDVNILDYGGNARDAALLAAMAALRAFRRPEISLASGGSSSSGFGDGEIDEGAGQSGGTSVIKHKFDDREPLPLAFNHTPLSVSVGIFTNPKNITGDKVHTYLPYISASFFFWAELRIFC